MDKDRNRTQSYLNDASQLIDNANNSIFSAFPPFDSDTYNSTESIQQIPSRIVTDVPPPIAPKKPVLFVDQKTALTVNEGATLSSESSNFWFSGLKGDLDWDNIKEDDITLNYDLNQYITPYTPEISGIWRPCILYTDPMKEKKNTNIQFSYSGLEEDCEAGLGLENFITITTPMFKTWEADSGLEVKIDWTIPKDLQTCSVMGVLFWYRHYDVRRELDIVKTYTINVQNQSTSISKTVLRSQQVMIDGKIIELKAQHEDHSYTSGSTSSNDVPLYGIRDNLSENDYVLVKKIKKQVGDSSDNASNSGSSGSESDNQSSGGDTYMPPQDDFDTGGNPFLEPGVVIAGFTKQAVVDTVISEHIYKVKRGLWVDMGPKRFIPGVDIYMPDSFFTINYDSNYVVKVIKGEMPGETKEATFEYYAKSNLITSDQSKYRGVLTSLVNLSNDNTLEQIFADEGLGEPADGYPLDIFLNKESRNTYIGLKNLARMLSTGPLVDMAAVYAYNKFDGGLDLVPYRDGDKFDELRTRLENVYGKKVQKETTRYTEKIENRLYTLKAGYYSYDDLIIRINGSQIPKTSWTVIDNSTIRFADSVAFEVSDNTISVSKNIYINDVYTNSPIDSNGTDSGGNSGSSSDNASDDGSSNGETYTPPQDDFDTGGNPFLEPGVTIARFLATAEDSNSDIPIFKRQSISLYNNIEDNDAQSIEGNKRLVKTKKDLAMSLTMMTNVAKNFYLQFNSGQALKLISKKIIDVPQVYMKLDFEQRRARSTQAQEFWYKQRMNVGGIDLYTKLKVPDDSEFEPAEYESLVLSIKDTNYETIGSSIKYITLFDFGTFNYEQSDLYNATLTSMYDAFGVNQELYKIIDLQKTLNNNFRNPAMTYNLGLVDNQEVIITRRLNDWTFDVDKGIVNKKRIIDELNKNNTTFKRSIDLLENRFMEISATKRSLYPELKEIYFHRLGGVLIKNSLLFTIGKNIFWNYHIAPVPIQDAQYFVESLPANNIDRPNKIMIQFECNEFLHIRLYDIIIENLRINTYESAGYRPFPNKLAVKSDITRVYDKIIGYEFNEETHILSTQFAPPIVAYGGHRKEDIDSLGVSIPNHPRPIEKDPNTGLYTALPANTLPYAAKNGLYESAELVERARIYGRMGMNLRDVSSVKCFLTPQYFYNEVPFRKGFFHPNLGWLDHSLLTGNREKLKHRTPVLPSGVSNCKTYGSRGKRFYPELVTKAKAEAKRKCKTTPLVEPPDLTILDPAVQYNVDEVLVHRVLPNLVTTNIDNNIDFISFMSAKLNFLNHPFPKDLRVSLFDAREYRFIAGYIVDKTIEYDIFFRQCLPNTKPEEITKLRELQVKENNSWTGPLAVALRTSPRFLLYNNSILNYEKNFNLTFNNYGYNNLKYAFNNDIVLPEDTLDYYIGSSGTIKGFGQFSTDGTLVSPESDNTWGLQISDMGGLDTGSTCFQLQVCTGCPVPNYEPLGGATGIALIPYNMIDYNGGTFDTSEAEYPYPSGYCFLGDFTNLKHLIPPVNLEAPYSAINKELGDFPCADEPDPPYPRELIKTPPDPEPVFIPPMHFPLTALLVHMGIMADMYAQGYDMPFGAFGGVWTPNPFKDDFGIKAKNRAYLANKGYLQIEGTTASYIKGYGFIKGISRDYEYGIPNKVEIDVKYKDCLWYTIEADIFKYTDKCSPVLDNTKFKYLTYKDYQSYPGFDYDCKLTKDATNQECLVIDGARPFYSFCVDDPVDFIYRVIKPSGLPNGDTIYVTVEKSGIFNVSNVNIPPINNPQYVPSVLDNSDFIELNPSVSTEPTDLKASDSLLPGTKTIIYLNRSIIESNNEKYLSGYLKKRNKNTLMLYDTTETENDTMIPFGKWGNIKNLNLGHIKSSSIKDQLFSEGSYGWGSNKINPKIEPIVRTPDLLGLHNFDYHFGKADYCGRVKVTRNDNTSKVIRIKYDPRIKYANMPQNPYAQSIDNQYIKYSGYPTDLKHIKNRIYMHNIFSISDANRTLYSFQTDNSKYGKYYLDKNLAKYYLPYYDLTLDNSLLGGFLDNEDVHNYVTIPVGQNLPNPGSPGIYYKFENSDTIYRWNATDLLYEDVSQLSVADKDYVPTSQGMASGVVQFENIFSRVSLEGTEQERVTTNNTLLYNDNYYWISIPFNASGSLASSSKIPYSIKQECDIFGQIWAGTACQNICNTQMVGPLSLDDVANDDVSIAAQDLAMFYTDSDSKKCSQVNYELRETTQSFYMGCGEYRNDSLVRLDLSFRYYVPEAAHSFLSASELLANSNEIKVRFKYIPRKIQTDFTLTLGRNAVNQSQLYFWECHEFNAKNIYTQKTRLNITPPFYQVLNEMIFRAWFGERQKIATQDTFGVDIFTQQNHYKWVPYEYDATTLFNAERPI